LNRIEEHNQSTADGAATATELSVLELVPVIWSQRRWLAKVIGVGALISIGIALLLPNVYTSTARLMPPDSQALSGTSLLSALAGGGSATGLAGGLLSAKTPGSTFIGILESQTSLDDVIDRLNLRDVYHNKFYVDARNALKARTVIDEDKKSGIISIAVTDRDPNRARDIAKAYVEELGKLVNKSSTSSARRERIFLEERIKSVKADLDADSLALSTFSSHNATFDPQRQGDATMETVGRLQGELAGAQAQLSGLRAQYTDENMQVRAVRGRVAELQNQLQKLGGVSSNSSDVDPKNSQLFPSVRQLPLLGVTYYDLYRKVNIQQEIYEILTKQYELAKVQEMKEIPPVKVLDEPEVPERKSSPHRSLVVLGGILIAGFAGIIWAVIPTLWDFIRRSRLPQLV
jgi:uncharacterized protein involved in exopolysaccharide biosynthesis